MTDKELVKLASGAKEKAYAPYSRFRVGAALITSSDKAYIGMNIENASYGATCCAERTAIFKAVSDGEKEIKTIAIASDSEEFIYPCGICRQVMAEFSTENTRVICSRPDGEYIVYSITELLPNAFKKLSST